MPSRPVAAATSALLLLTGGLAGAPVDDRLDPPARACAVDELRDRLADPSLAVLACDRRDRGHAVVAVGDVATAERLVVLVPGAGTDLGTLAPAPGEEPRPHGRPLDWARTLAAYAAPRTAVVLWVGYTTPAGVDLVAATGSAARAAVPALVDTVDDLQQRAPHRPRTTVVGHSYGAVVVSLAAADLNADALVLLGSPGARARRVDELGTSAPVWAARSSSDWVRHLPSWRLGDLGHGTDPTDPSFGASVLPADDHGGHDGYLVPGSSTLDALVRVVEGPAAATPARPTALLAVR